MTDWKEGALAQLVEEGYTNPERLLKKVEERSRQAEWLAIPNDIGYFINYEGRVDEIVGGSMTGERTVFHYLQSGPWLRIPDSAFTRPKREAVDAALYEPLDKLNRIQSILNGEDDD